MPTTFILNTPRVNSYGFRILSQGIELEAFLKNPILLYRHGRDAMPIGRWENLRIEGENLIGDAVFDTEDPMGAEVARKVEAGFLHACSVWVEPIELSEDMAMILPGQYRPTVVRSSMLEGSIVDIPGNPDAVRLSFPKHGMTLTENPSPAALDLLLPPIQPKENMKNIALRLGLSEAATEADILSAIEALQAASEQEAPAPEAPAPAPQEAQTEAPQEAATTLSALVRELRLNRQPQTLDERASWSYMDWAKKDPSGLEKLQREKPEKFQALVNSLKA